MLLAQASVGEGGPRKGLTGEVLDGVWKINRWFSDQYQRWSMTSAGVGSVYQYLNFTNRSARAPVTPAGSSSR